MVNGQFHRFDQDDSITVVDHGLLLQQRPLGEIMQGRASRDPIPAGGHHWAWGYLLQGGVAVFWRAALYSPTLAFKMPIAESCVCRFHIMGINQQMLSKLCKCITIFRLPFPIPHMWRVDLLSTGAFLQIFPLTLNDIEQFSTTKSGYQTISSFVCASPISGKWCFFVPQLLGSARGGRPSAG